MSKRTRDVDRLVGGDITDPVILCGIFYRAHDPCVSQKNALRSTFVNVPVEVYDAVVCAQEEGLRLIDSIDAVMRDDEHALIFEEALMLRHNMPDRFLFMSEVEEYRRALHDFDPYALERKHNGYLKVPSRTAFQMKEMMKYHCFMVARVFDDCFNTDYMKQFGFYKRSGLQYQGPNALQGAMNVMVSMQKVLNASKQQERLGRQRPDWENLLNTYDR